MGWVERSLELLGKIPTTQGQFCVAWMLWLGTGARYLAFSTTWSPSYEWLGALLLLSGVSTAHFLGKRVTDTGYVETKAKLPPRGPPTPGSTP